ncbi:sugar phosphate isomerase/epimerase family protein [Adhaeribacter radiodurans]|uniref:Sugar phosphate isomerase/epimerase n=1 Tax=Adhaeribacter radiodurans TaxID=2745197 RepID=A0A7L7L8L0_9BACT|nr:sugar phosphate isomerase/epimerase [Adhaeribacter radiodurans]QMU29138.1 sugar phosphate isomerase/epimerase [Adhaeribacter radiodurans]
MKKISYLFSLLLFSGQFLPDADAQSGKPLFPQMPGMEAYTYRVSFKKDVAATLDTIKSLGFTELETGTNPYGLTAEAFRKMLDERNLKSPSVGAGYEEIVKDPVEVARKAKVLGAKYVMVAWIPHQKEFTLADAQKAASDFNRVGKILKDQGITFCYHNHGYEFVPYNNGTLFDYLAANTDPRYVSFEMDILWAFHGGQDPVQLLNKYGSRWKLMHLKDLKKGVKGDLTGNTPIENDVALGTGQLDIPAILKAAKKVGIKHYFIEDESPQPHKQVPQTLTYLKSLTE